MEAHGTITPGRVDPHKKSALDGCLVARSRYRIGKLICDHSKNITLKPRNTAAGSKRAFEVIPGAIVPLIYFIHSGYSVKDSGCGGLRLRAPS